MGHHGRGSGQAEAVVVAKQLVGWIMAVFALVLEEEVIT
jgi:hypothetical protein